MPDAAQSRELAAHMLTLAMNTTDQHWLEQLCVRACEYLDWATALEATALPVTSVEKKN